MILDYINQHLAGFWIALGFVLLTLEVLVFGFSTIVLFFSGLGGLVTGLLMMLDVLPTNWMAGISGFGILTGVSSVLMWRPLKRLQGGSVPVQAGQSSDFIGIKFILHETITQSIPGVYRYSGVNWRIEIDPTSGSTELERGQQVVVTSVDAGIFRVSPSSKDI